MKQAEYYADQLWQARLSGAFCDPIMESLSVDQAYAIQAACAEVAPPDDRVIGFKIGATNQETLDTLGLDEPFYGPLYKSAFATNDGLKDQLQLPLYTQHNSRVEAEFVVCMKNDFARGSGSSDVLVNDIREHIDWVAPGLEIVASRFIETTKQPGCLAIADFGANQYMIVGEPCNDWSSLNLNSHPVKLSISNQPDVNGHSGMSIYGNPLEFVCWLLNQADMLEVGLKSGQIVSCGTCSGAPNIAVGDQITADYGTLGRLAIDITAQTKTAD